MPKPVCVRCRRFYTVKQDVVAFEEMRQIHVAWDQYNLAPCRLWIADLMACPGCGAEILLTAHDQRPITEHYQNDYDVLRATLKPSVRVEG